MLDRYSDYARPVGSDGSVYCLCETHRLSWISIVFMRDLLAQLYLYSDYADLYVLLDLYSVDARPLCSV